MEPLDKLDEQRIMKALGSAVELSNGGMDPSDAICKSASEAQFTTPFVRRMVEAYNVSRTLAHFKKASLDDKTASFPLADADVVLEKMFPAHVDAFAAREQTLKAAQEVCGPATVGRDNFSKVAAEGPLWKPITVEGYAQDRDTVVRQAYNVRDRMRGTVKVAEAEARINYWKFFESITKVAEHFKLAYRENDRDVLARVLYKHGSVGMSVIGAAAGASPADIVKLSELRSDQERVYPDRAPYREIDKAVEFAKQTMKFANAAAKARKALVQWESISSPFVKASIAPADVLARLHLATDVGRDAGLIPSKEDTESLGLKSKAKALDEIFDPSFNMDMRAIRVQSMMNDMMTNDPVISTYEPARVINAYNQVAQFVPQAAQEPLLVRGMLRKMLQTDNALEQFDVKDLSETERSISQREPPSQYHFKPGTGGERG